MCKVSIIVPVFNVEKYLKRCIDSILCQTFSDFELILVDDGSPDNSGKICDEYAKKDSRINVIHKSNAGVSAARNSGLDVATGEYISFIDGDDWIDDNFIEILYKNAVENKVDISIVNYHKEYDNYRKAKTDVVEGLYTNTEALKYLYFEFALYTNVPWNKLFKRKLFESIRYPVGKVVSEDAHISYKLIYNANGVYFSNDDLYHYYQRSDSAVHGEFTLNKLDEFDVYKERKSFFTENGWMDLVEQNNTTMLACIKSLSVRNEISSLDKTEKRKCYNKFKREINAGVVELPEKPSLSDRILFISPELFAKFYNIKSIIFKKVQNFRQVNGE